jgi:CPA1 family monovalent cation:H+ antiporter
MDRAVLEEIIFIIVIGSLMAIVARRLKIPYVIGLVVAGILLSLLPVQVDIPFSKDFIFEVLLPPLVFEATLYIDWREHRRDMIVVATYATLGVILSALVTASIMRFSVGWLWPAAMIFGTLIAATDPLSVIATFKEANVKGRLRLLVEAESLFNDSTAAVAYTVAIAFAAGEPLGFGAAAWLLISNVVGGVVCGALFAVVVLLIIGRTKDHLVELALTTLVAFGSFWLAEHFHFSGILATTTAGLIIGDRVGRGWITDRGEESMESFWQFAAFVANSIIFIILGINLGTQNFSHFVVAILFAIAAVLAGRAAAVYPLSLLFAKSDLKVETPYQHVLFWGGLRGALALALALGVPESLPYREDIIGVTFGVVAFSVFVQTPTVKPLMRYLGILPKEERQKEVDVSSDLVGSDKIEGT